VKHVPTQGLDPGGGSIGQMLRIRIAEVSWEGA
jgi:hypothetical protein